MRGKCNLGAFDAKIEEVRRTHKPSKKFKPLFEHILHMAKHSASVGYCQRAGQELKQAKKVAGYR